MNSATKLVLTGGPSGGKTTLANLIQKEFSDRVVIVPEAASILYSGGFPRRPNITSVQHRQRAIYYVQRELEGIVGDEFARSLLICDRGSLDGIAYWPGKGHEYLASLGSSVENEVARYDWVLHLDTAPEPNYDISNPLRTESYAEAYALNQRVKEAWAAHPQRLIISNDGSGHFINKMNRALTVVHDILEGRSFAEIRAHLEASTRTVPLLEDSDS